MYLRTKWLGRHWHHLAKVTSTNSHLANLTADSEPEGSVVVAEEQNLGRGRMARRWFSPPGVNLYMSALFMPKISTKKVSSMYQLVGLAVVRAIRKLHPKIPVTIKWPNDLLVDGKKLGGILCDMRANADRGHFLIVGIGVNVNMRYSELPLELAGRATSLREWLKHDASRPKLAAEILNQLEPLYKAWLTKGLEPLITELEKLSFQQGQQVAVSMLSGEVRGKAVGIAPSGALILETMTGERKEILAGDVQVRKS